MSRSFVAYTLLALFSVAPVSAQMAVNPYAPFFTSGIYNYGNLYDPYFAPMPRAVIALPAVNYVKTDSIRGQMLNNWANSSPSATAKLFRLYKFVRNK